MPEARVKILRTASDLEADADVYILSREAALRSAGGLEELLSEMVSMFREEREEQLLGAQKALDGSDAAGLRLAAHTLKGACATLGAERARVAALELERVAADQELAPAPALLAKLREELVLLEPELDQLA